MGCGASKVAPETLDNSTAHAKETEISKLSNKSLQNTPCFHSDSDTNENKEKKSEIKENEITKENNEDKDSLVPSISDEEGRIRPPLRLAPLDVPNHGKDNDIFSSTENCLISEEERKRRKRKTKDKKLLENESSTTSTDSDLDNVVKTCVNQSETSKETETAELSVTVQQYELEKDASFEANKVEDECNAIESQNNKLEIVEDKYKVIDSQSDTLKTVEDECNNIESQSDKLKIEEDESNVIHSQSDKLKIVEDKCKVINSQSDTQKIEEDESNVIKSQSDKLKIKEDECNVIDAQVDEKKVDENEIVNVTTTCIKEISEDIEISDLSEPCNSESQQKSEGDLGDGRATSKELDEVSVPTRNSIPASASEENFEKSVTEGSESDPNTHYAALLCRLLLDAGHETLKRKFDTIHPPEILRSSLKARYKMLLSLRSKRILKPKRWGKLFPHYPVQPDSNTFDLTLLCLLFRTICNLTPPLTGWDWEPLPEDSSVAANLAWIGCFRRSVLQHVSESSLDQSTFERLWQEISKTLVDLGADENDITDLRKSTLPTDEVLLVQRLSEWDAEEEELRQVSPASPIKKKSSLLDGIEKLRKESRCISISEMSLDGHPESPLELDFQPDIKRLMGLYETDVERLAEQYEKDTRQALLSKIGAWMDDRNSERMMLLNGVAGSGKSVISAVVCKNAELRGCLAGSQFFHRDNPMYSDPRRMLRSLAQQLCINVPWFQTKLTYSLQQKASVNLNCLSVKDLFFVLFEEPLKNLHDPGNNFLVILDGLDDSMYYGRYAVLDTVVNHFNRLPLWVKLFVTTQPEDEILEPLKLNFELNVVKSDDATAREDIKLCYEKKLWSLLQGIAAKDDIFKRLVDKSFGVFLYSRFISDYLARSKAHLTSESLDSLLPSNVYNICDDYFKTVQSKLNCSEQVLSDFVCAVTAAPEPLPIALVLKLLNLQNEDSQEKQKNMLCTAVEGFTPILHVRQENLHLTHKCVVDIMPNLSSRRHRGNLILWKLCEKILEDLKQSSNIYLKDLSLEECYALRNYLYHLCGCQAAKDQQMLKLIANSLLDVEIASAKLLINCNMIEEIDHYLVSRPFPAEYIRSIETLKECVCLYEKLGFNNIHLFLQTVSQNEKCTNLADEAKELINSCKFGHGVTFSFSPVTQPTDKAQGLYVISSFPTNVEITAFSVSPDNEYLVCACTCESTTSVSLWSLSSRTPRWRRSPIGNVTDANIAFSPDGSMVLTGSLTHAHRVADGKRVEFFPMSDHKFRRCAYSPNRSQFGTVDAEDGSFFCLWDMTSGKKMFQISTAGWIEDFTLSGCGKFLACVTRILGETHGRSIEMWGVHGPDPEKMGYRDVSPSFVCTLAFTPDSRYVVCGTDTVSVWRMGSNGALEEVAVTLPAELEGANLTGTASTSVATSEFFPIFSKGSTFYLVELEPKENTVWFKVVLAWGHDSHSIARFVHVLSSCTCALVRYLYTPDVYLVTNIPTRTQQMKISRDGSTLGVLCDKTFTRYSLPKGQLLYRKEILDEETGDNQHLVESKDKPCAIISSEDGELKLWEIDTTNGYPRTVAERGHSVLSAKSLGDNRVAVRTITNLKTIRVWNADTLQEEFVFDHQTDVLDFDVSPDGEHVVSCDVEGNTACWSVHERTQDGQMTISHAEWIKAWPDERIIVTGGSHSCHAINLRDRITGELVRSLIGHTSRVTGCAPIRNGSLIVSFSQDKTLRVWKVVTGELVGFMQFHEPVENLVSSNAKDHFALSFASGEIRAVEFHVPDNF